jgi:hypothetical protein
VFPTVYMYTPYYTVSCSYELQIVYNFYCGRKVAQSLFLNYMQFLCRKKFCIHLTKKFLSSANSVQSRQAVDPPLATNEECLEVPDVDWIEGLVQPGLCPGT